MKYYFVTLLIVVTLLFSQFPTYAGPVDENGKPTGESGSTTYGNPASQTGSTSPATSPAVPPTQQNQNASLLSAGMDVAKQACVQMCATNPKAKTAKCATTNGSMVLCCPNASTVMCLPYASAKRFANLLLTPSFTTRLTSLDPQAITQVSQEAANMIKSARCGKDTQAGGIWGSLGALIGGVVGTFLLPGLGTSGGAMLGSALFSLGDALFGAC